MTDERDERMEYGNGRTYGDWSGNDGFSNASGNSGSDDYSGVSVSNGSGYTGFEGSEAGTGNGSDASAAASFGDGSSSESGFSPAGSIYSGFSEKTDAASGSSFGSTGYSAESSYEGSAGNTGYSAESGYGAGSENGSSASGNGRYYSYSRGSASSGSAGYGGRPGGDDSGTAGRKGKGSRRLGMVLAVILVFILGAGAGAYVSGRSATAALSEGSTSRSADGRGGSSVQTGENEAADGENEDAAQEESTETTDNKDGQTIQKVADENLGITGNSLEDTGVADVAEKVMPAIVSVYNKYTEQGQFFGRTYTQEGESAGSGIIIEETDGELLIVTNNHVVEGADSLSVQFINEENCEAALKGTDSSTDLAVISVSLDDLSADTKKQIAIAKLGDSDSLRIGEHAIAIGNALGYGQSLTVGYISALNREMTSENGITGTFIQTDAAINPGNSGGALLNAKGEVIGINSNKIGGSSVEGMGFAIPISKAIPIIDSLKTQESRTKVAEEDRGVLGIYGISVTSDVASAYGLPVGAYVEEVIEGGGAAQSDLQAGDIITAINGQTVTGMDDLQQQLVYYEAGREVTLTVQHPMEGGSYEEREVKVTLSKSSALESSRNSGGNRQDQNAWPSEEEDGYNFFGFPFGF